MLLMLVEFGPGQGIPLPLNTSIKAFDGADHARALAILEIDKFFAFIGEINERTTAMMAGLSYARRCESLIKATAQVIRLLQSHRYPHQMPGHST